MNDLMFLPNSPPSSYTKTLVSIRLQGNPIYAYFRRALEHLVHRFHIDNLQMSGPMLNADRLENGLIRYLDLYRPRGTLRILASCIPSQYFLLHLFLLLFHSRLEPVSACLCYCLASQVPLFGDQPTGFFFQNSPMWKCSHSG